MPLTPSFKLPTTLPPFTLFTFSPFASLKISAFFNICSFSSFLTQMTFSRPLMYWPRMMGCVFGRGEMWIWIWGWARAKEGKRAERRNCLDGGRWVSGGGEGVGEGGGGGWGNELHALGAGPVVAVVEFQAFALQDECADAILGGECQ